ncbi:hypothetical protein IMG5_198780 [Ichthyophthirius multifiliis]|uniref:Uncharacterized protein n=1 Tax=Ichthyophthirius multifiliis TaxID=5932 RepID=G0R5G4_ICHMU|nr:hypothetical protein IMG5_198780 [Ichthyophthirius multifiliis]EGR27286.1 hypothetical protein IMG5_198780 [Ichthyophthirius multifiliis]|eukprot:XP_004024170.1 hypothetical protein IMG5_198780 [Ichthyophthirius multifiliis]
MQKDPQHTSGLCVLNEAQIDALREVFVDLDKHNDCIVKRQEFDSQEEQIYDIDQNYLQLIQDIFDMIPRVNQNLDFVFTTDFILQCKKDPQIRSIENEIARLKSNETQLDKESICQVLDRILQEANEYTEWEDIRPFFSLRV